MVIFGGGLILFVVAALPMIGALRLVLGLGILWILAAASLMLLGIAQVLRYSLHVQQHDEMSAVKLGKEHGRVLTVPDRVYFDLALKQFLLAARHQRPLSCIAVEISEDSLGRLSNEAGWSTPTPAMEASALGLAAKVTADATRRSDLTIRGSAPRRLVVLCPETRGAAAVRAAQKVDQALRRDLGLEVQTGVSAFPGDASSLKELLQRAESELQHPGSVYDSRQLVLEFQG